jgi:hypothetical protein
MLATWKKLPAYSSLFLYSANIQRSTMRFMMLIFKCAVSFISTLTVVPLRTVKSSRIKVRDNELDQYFESFYMEVGRETKIKIWEWSYSIVTIVLCAQSHPNDLLSDPFLSLFLSWRSNNGNIIIFFILPCSQFFFIVSGSHWTWAKGQSRSQHRILESTLH